MVQEELIVEFRKNFESLMNEREKLIAKIKKEAVEQIEVLIQQDKFDASQIAIEHLKELLDELQLKLDLSDVSDIIVAYYKSTEKLIDSHSAPEETTVPVNENIRQNETTHENTKQEEGPSTTSFVGKQDWSEETIKERFSKNHFEIIRFEKNDLELRKKRKKYWLTITNPSITKEEVNHILNEKCIKKNIGFVCTNDAEMEKLKAYADEWARENKDKTKFLSINFTSKNRLLKNKTSDIFYVKSY